MSVDLTPSIVRILKPDGTTAGTGFVVSDEGLIATCSHVVQDEESQRQGEPRPDYMDLILHATGDRRRARVELDWWRPANAEDVAILRLEGGLPESVQPLPLGPSAGSKGHPFETFGFPEASLKGGIGGYGEILRETTIEGVRVLQLRSQEVTPGFSGAPVWDQEAQQGIGMVTAITPPDRYGRLVETAFATPTDVLIKVCPEMERILQEPVVPLGKLSNVPDLPPHFLSRPDHLERLRVAVLADIERPVVVTGTAPKVGVQGMGGIGKSVLAAALARDPEVRRAFPDGVLWVTVGREPALTLRQSQLVQALGDPPHAFKDAQQGKAHLSELLEERACLVILDDVWNVEHARAFDALGPRCRMLVTTRDAGLIVALGAVEHQVDVLNDEQALTLLAEWAGQAVEALPAEAHKVVQECGHLPLALAMTGAMLRGKPSDRWGNVLHKLRNADLEKIQQKFPNYPYPNLLGVIQVSVEALEPEVQARYLDFAVFPEDTPIPEAVLQTLWEPEGLDAYGVQDVVDMLVDRSLARRGEAGRLSLHDLQFDYIRRQAEDLPALHDRLLRAYEARCPNGWPTGPEDGYFFEHLTFHLREAGKTEALYELVEDPAWYAASRAYDPSRRSYALDVARAIDAAEQEGPACLPHLVAYSLWYATLGTLATNVPSEALELMARLGEGKRALDYAALMVESEKQAEAYRRIGSVLWARGQAQPAREALARALAVAEGIEDEWSKAWALVGVAQALAGVGEQALARQALARALATAEGIRDEGFKAEALVGVVQALAGVGEQAQARQALDRALALAEGIRDKEDKAEALVGVAQALAEVGKFEHALAVAEGIKIERRKAEALRGVAQALAEVGEFKRALAAAEEMRYRDDKAEALARVAQALAGLGEQAQARQALDRALAVAEGIWGEKSKSKVLVSVAQALAAVGEFKRALAAADAIRNEGCKAEALAGVVQALAAVGERAQTRQARASALAAAEGIWWPEHRARVLVSVAQALAAVGEQAQARQVLARALATAEGIKIEGRKAEALRGVAQALAAVGEQAQARQVLSRALVATEGIQDEGFKAEALVGVAQALAGVGEFERALAAAEGIRDEEDKARALSSVVQALAAVGEQAQAQDALARALAAAEGIRDEEFKARALSSVVQALAGAGEQAQARQALARALATAEGIRDEEDKAKALVGVAQALAAMGDRAGLVRTLAAAEGIKIERYKAEALVGVAQALAGAGEFERALVAAEGIRDEEDKAKALVGVAQALAAVGDRAGLVRTLAAAEGIKIEGRKAEALRGVAQALAAVGEQAQAREVLSRALAAADAIRNEGCKAEALVSVAQALAAVGEQAQAREVLSRALAAAEGIEWEWAKAEALVSVAQALAAVGEQAQAREVLSRALAAAEGIEWEWAKAEALVSVAQALAEVGEFERALAAAEGIRDEGFKAEALVSVAQALAAVGEQAQARQVLSRALATAEGIEWEWARVEALVGVALALVKVGEQAQARQALVQALAAAEGIRDERRKAEALVGVAQALAEVTTPSDGVVALHHQAFRHARTQGRRNAWVHIRAFAPVLAALGRPIIAQTWQRIQAVERLAGV